VGASASGRCDSCRVDVASTPAARVGLLGVGLLCVGLLGVGMPVLVGADLVSGTRWRRTIGTVDVGRRPSRTILVLSAVVATGVLLVSPPGKVFLVDRRVGRPAQVLVVVLGLVRAGVSHQSVSSKDG
jgi:hypothetical protein